MAELGTFILYFSVFVSLFFEVFLLITYLEVREELELEKSIDKGIKDFPSVSVIVPCWNEEKTLRATVSSILHLDYPQEKLSIVLVNDGSTDGTMREINRFRKHPQVKILSKPNGGKYTALNLALKYIRSELVGCLDADSFVSPETLRKMVPLFADTSIMAVTPSIKVFKPRNILQHAQKIEYVWGIWLRRLLSSLGALYVTPGAFSIFRTKVFKELGGYVEGHQTEDLEIALRMQKNRYRIACSHGAYVYTTTPPSLKTLFKQRVRWAYGFLNNALDYRAMFFNKQYGHVGLFILPIAVLSIFTTLYLAVMFLWQSSSGFLGALTRVRTVGFGWELSLPSFDWYFLNTGALEILALITLGLTFLILFLSIGLAEGRARVDKGIFYYLILYIFIVPLWLGRAMFSTITKRKVNWR